MLTKAIRMMSVAALVAMFVSIPGCTARSITITTNPPGAEVTINHRVIGNSPCRVGFTHYGVYRIEIRKEKFETLVKEECINPPVYGYEPVTLVTDNLLPARLNDDIYLHYVMKAEGEVTERKGLLDRANAAARGEIKLADGRSFSVPYSRPEKTPEQLAKDAKAKADLANPPTVTKEGVPIAPLPPKDNDFKIKSIGTEEPKGPRIAPELNIKPKPVENKPDETKVPEVKKDQSPVRTPKSEELQFEKPSAPKTDVKK
ncbi:MAG: PEGA domain-containing protein [Planctomycetota bacterium]